MNHYINICYESIKTPPLFLFCGTDHKRFKNFAKLIQQWPSIKSVNQNSSLDSLH